MCFTSAAPEFLIYIPIIIVIALEVLNDIRVSIVMIFTPEHYYAFDGPLITIVCFGLLFFNRVTTTSYYRKQKIPWK